MSRKQWTEDEIIYLEYYIYSAEERDYKAAAEFLDRSLNAVQLKASKLRKENKDIGYLYKPYSDYEIEYIKTNYKKLSLKSMSEHLGRSENALTLAANKIGIKRLNRFNIKDDKALRNMAEEGLWISEIARRLRYHRKTIANYAKKHGIKIKLAPREVQGGYFRKRAHMESMEQSFIKQKLDK
ncbi:hypothetical protein ACS127_10270 [Amphibacillus sp. Q70]|uniref:hypothetical protein n=1 Tax=Amphibacillus sp. Q70 TaxID=3453416 RepID=UPI003F87A254